MKILIIEPDRLLARQYSQALKQVGDCNFVATAQEAITSIDESKPDLIILELLLKAHNGVEFLYELRSYDDLHNLPIILHTYTPQEKFSSDETVLHELGIKDYLYKPETSLQQLALSAKRICEKSKP